MYGWDVAGSAPVAETWTWNGVDWSRSVSAGPQLEGPAIAYDPTVNNAILFGETLAGGTPQTWQWHGDHWVQLSPGVEPPPRSQAGLATDPTTHSIVLFGGISASLNQDLSDTWSWNGITWSHLSPTASPPPRAQEVLVSASAQRKVLLLGGEHAPDLLGDAWTWDGSTWTQVPSVGIRDGARAVDTGTEVVLFGGGTGPYSISNETWLWNGQSWSLQ
jgi:hypothetical protein